MNRRPGNYSPGFTDHPVRKGVSPDINPYLVLHREYPEVIPADQGPGYKGRWSEAFGREAPLFLELGAGNGFHLSGMAAQHPESNWLGLELRFKRVVLIAKKIRAAGLQNAKILRYNWFYLDDLFEDASLDGLALHHPDPWPKEDQAHNRIIDPPFVAQVARLLKPGAEWRMKTDFEPHIEALLSCAVGQPFEVVGRSMDVQRDGAPWERDVITNYQRKSYEKGITVYAVALRRL